MDNNNINGKTAVALGMFDGVHLGHIEVIKSALSQQENGLVPAAFTFRVLGKEPADGFILPYQMKFSLLKAAGIKTVYSSDFDSVRGLSAEAFVEDILCTKMNCGHVTCGWNFKFSRNAGANADDLKLICERKGVGLKIIPPVSVDFTGKHSPVSSTKIREAIRDGEIELANKMLGRELAYELEVLEGEKLGRLLGAPTINQIIPNGCVLPKFGVYGSVVTIDGNDYTSVTNIGIKPTVDGGNSEKLPAKFAPIMETHIPGFNTDVYGQTVTVSLCKFIREERKFDSIEELKRQIQLDIETVLK